MKTRERVIATHAKVTDERIGGRTNRKVRVIAPTAHCSWHRDVWAWQHDVPEAGAIGHLVYVSYFGAEGDLLRGTLEFREGDAPRDCECVNCREQAT